jgi:PadR family transcriptional regulator, regulatory protein AphA
LSCQACHYDADVSLRHAVLGLLILRPGTGYELTQRFDLSLANAWYASHSQIYPELARLEAEGLAEVVGEGARRSRTFAATEAGRSELRRWLLESEPNRSQRNETALRWFLVFLLDPEERRAVLERELADGLAAAASRREFSAGLDAQGRTGSFRQVLDLAARMDEVMAAWLREQIEVARDEADDDAPAGGST